METSTVTELVEQARAAARLAEKTDDWDDWNEYRGLLWRAAADGPGALTLGQELTGAQDPGERELGCTLLGYTADRNEEVAPEAAATLVALAERETDGEVRRALVRALGRTHEQCAVPVLVTLARHPDADVRSQVAYVFSEVFTGLPDGPDIRALIGLTRDEDPDVRDRATHTLGFLSEADTAEVRSALWERTDDEYAEARKEGIRGLARRHDPRAVPLMAELLDDPEGVSSLTFRAAGILGAPELLPYLRQYNLKDSDVSDAVEACDPEERARLEAAGWELLHELDRLRPDLRAGLYRPRFEEGLSLVVGEGDYDVAALLRRAGGDPARAAGLADADLPVWVPVSDPLAGAEPVA
ncbi:HEAT repeat domain-containing protein [Kitasatospora sp. NPDC051853]|uniref:HEAT repeat domain-containing protein n=1 Tax=Kitasatospora sp. NPDC051853 TaxID=3364058 RepID=UPI003793E713